MKKYIFWILLLIPFNLIAAERFCTMDAMECPDGTWVWRSWPNCEFNCPNPILNPALCSTVYSPVCAQPPMPNCAEGMMCVQVMPSPKTYSNSCLANLDSSEILYIWECKSDQIADNELKWCISWYDGCNSCLVENWKITACTEMACFTQQTPYCKEYELTAQMQQLLRELNWEIMFLWWSKYFDESLWTYNTVLIENDISLYNKMLTIKTIDLANKDKIKVEIESLKKILSSNQQIISSDDQLKCQFDWGEHFVFENTTFKGLWLCRFANWKVCESQKYYQWKCSKLFNLSQNKQINSVHKAFKSVAESMWENLNKRLLLMVKIANRIDLLKSRLSSLNQLSLVFNIIDNWYNKYTLQLIQEWAIVNIDLLNLEPPVLWWSWYVVETKNIAKNKYEIIFEDWHIQSVISIYYYIENNKLMFTIIE